MSLESNIYQVEFVQSCSFGMGRLMDSVMAALGQKPSDRVQISSSAPEKSMENKISRQKPEDKPLSPEMEKLIEEMENQSQNKQIGDRSIFSFVSKPPSSLNAKDNKEKPENRETDRKNVGEVAADVEKKEENAKDCFGCKVVSVGAATFGCGYGLYVAKVNPNKVEGLRLTSTRIGGIVLAMGKYIN